MLDRSVFRRTVKTTNKNDDCNNKIRTARKTRVIAPCKHNDELLLQC